MHVGYSPQNDGEVRMKQRRGMLLRGPHFTTVKADCSAMQDVLRGYTGIMSKQPSWGKSRWICPVAPFSSPDSCWWSPPLRIKPLTLTNSLCDLSRQREAGSGPRCRGPSMVNGIMWGTLQGSGTSLMMWKLKRHCPSYYGVQKSQGHT